MPRPAATPPTAFGERLLAACEARGWTLMRLAVEAGYTSGRPSQLVRTEQPTRAVVERLARALGVDRSVLDPELTPSKNS
jgi:transcriptional regulator with XRE-family HTH domain